MKTICPDLIILKIQIILSVVIGSIQMLEIINMI